MLGLLSRLFNQILVGVCLGSLSMLLLALVALLRLAPRFGHLVALSLRALLILTFRLYRIVLARAAFTIQRYLHIDILNGLARVLSCVLLSLALGSLLLLLLPSWTTVWCTVLCLCHGLSVGLAWDEIEQPGGLRTGARIQ